MLKQYCLFIAIVMGVCAHAHDTTYFDVCSGIAKSIHPRVSVSIDEEFWGDTKITGSDTWFLVSLKAAPWLTVSPFFCYATDQVEHHLNREYRSGSYFVFTEKLDGWSFQLRSRWALRDKETSDRLTIQTRNGLRVRPPWVWTKYKIGPYAQYDSYFENRQQYQGVDRFYAHRGTLGVSANLTENIYLSLFYIRHWGRSGDEWAQSNILGTGLYLTY